MPKSSYNQDYFKIGGRRPIPGDDTAQQVEKQQFAEERAREKREENRQPANQNPSSVSVDDEREEAKRNERPEAATHGDEGGGGSYENEQE
jgi:hypothetical protein